MKKVLLSLAAIAALASCSNDDLGNDPNNPLNGAATFVQFSLDRNATRAVTDPEIDITAAGLYIFSAGVLEGQVEIASGQSEAIATSVGAKEILILANTKNNWNEAGIGKAFPSFETGATIATVRAALEAINVNNPYLTTPVADGLNFVDQTLAGNGFVMTTSTVVTVPEGGTAEAPKELFVPVYRAGSKIALGVDFTTINTTPSRKKIDGNISAPNFALVQTSKSIPLGRQYYALGVSPFDPIDGTTVTNPAPEINSDKTFTGAIEVAEDGLGYKHLHNYNELKDAADETTLNTNAWKASETLANNTTTPLVLEKFLFIPENVVAGVLDGNVTRGETTFSALKVTYAPTTGEMNDGETINAGTSFWAIQHKVTRKLATIADAEGVITRVKFFSDSDKALAFQGANTGKLPSADYQIVEFKSGLMYYRVDLTNAKHSATKDKHSILRNSKYLVDVNNVNDYGAPSMTDLVIDPEKPVEEVANIKVTIKVVEYNEIATTPDLG
jgi:hypothetical protein